MALPLHHSTVADRQPLDADELLAVLREHLVPQAIARNLASRTLAIWSAGCAAGAELYGIASLLETHFPELGGWLVTLYGSDSSTGAVAAARSGRVIADTASAVRAGLRLKCFFEEVDLLEEWPALPVFDLVLCRGVLGGLDIEAREDVLTRFQSRLGRNGHVVLGAGESWFGGVDGYRREQYGATVAFRFSA